MVAINNDFVFRLCCAIDTSLVTYRDYIPWCDAVIAEEERPAQWLLELAMTKYRPEAVRILNLAAHSNFEEEWDPGGYGDFWICCQFLRYERREISRATFLEKAGEHADRATSTWECEAFYQQLNCYEMSEFSRLLEETQVAGFRDSFSAVIGEVSTFYEPFQESFGRYRE